jgi:hypothetical protein
MSRDNAFFLRCSCGSSAHTAILTHDPEYDDYYLSVVLDQFKFWKRVRTAFRYVFAPRTIPYGMTAELVLTTADVNDLCRFIKERQA